jgi:hypothetical protein
MRTFAILALLGLVSAADVESHAVSQRLVYKSNVDVDSESDSDSSDSDSGDEDVSVANEIMFKPGDNGHAGYSRKLPTRFSTGDDDLFVRSMISKYAIEGEVADAETATGDGVFTMDEAATMAAATEVLANHMNLVGAPAAEYLATYFAKAWGHFDVNKSGEIAVVRTPEFMRFLCSDQRMSLGQ